MNKSTLAVTALIGLSAASLLIAPASASASCAGRKTTGTVLGGVGGALVGNSIAHGGGGAILGGVGGAVLGHELARCDDRPRAEYAPRSHHRRHRR